MWCSRSYQKIMLVNKNVVVAVSERVNAENYRSKYIYKHFEPQFKYRSSESLFRSKIFHVLPWRGPPKLVKFSSGPGLIKIHNFCIYSAASYWLVLFQCTTHVTIWIESKWMKMCFKTVSARFLASSKKRQN